MNVDVDDDDNTSASTTTTSSAYKFESGKLSAEWAGWLHSTPKGAAPFKHIEVEALTNTYSITHREEYIREQNTHT